MGEEWGPSCSIPLSADIDDHDDDHDDDDEDDDDEDEEEDVEDDIGGVLTIVDPIVHTTFLLSNYLEMG